MKDFTMEFVPCLINSFVINDVYKSLKENVSITWKQAKWFSYFILQNLKDTEDKLEYENNFNDFDAITRFQAYQAQRRYKELFLFFPFFKK